MRRFLTLLVLCLAVSTRAETDQRALLGTWIRPQDQALIEITFTRDGIFSQSIISAGEGRRIARIEGRWLIEGDAVNITLPSTAPVGVTPRQDRVVTWRVDKASATELIVFEKGGKEPWRFSKTK